MSDLGEDYCSLILYSLLLFLILVFHWSGSHFQSVLKHFFRYFTSIFLLSIAVLHFIRAKSVHWSVKLTGFCWKLTYFKKSLISLMRIISLTFYASNKTEKRKETPLPPNNILMFSSKRGMVMAIIGWDVINRRLLPPPLTFSPNRTGTRIIWGKGTIDWPMFHSLRFLFYFCDKIGKEEGCERVKKRNGRYFDGNGGNAGFFDFL